MSPSIIVIYCGLLITVTAFAVDITLPAFGLIADDLMADYGRVQLIVPLFLMCTGIGQMLVGPLCDKYGRKPVIVAGLLIFMAGTIICYFAPDIEVLLAGRALQGLGAAAGPVVGRAIIRDLFTGLGLARNLALASMIFAFGPIIAPLLGVSIMMLGTWRLIFVLIGLFGLALLLFGWLALPETIPARDPSAVKPSVLRRNLVTSLHNPQSRFYLIMAGPITAMMMTILVAVPRVFSETFGVDGVMFAVLFALHGTGIIIGQIVNRRIIASRGTRAAMRIGAGVLVTCTLSMGVLNALGLMSAYVLTAAMIAYATGYLVVFSNAAALALEPHGRIAGFVSSVFGLSSQLFAGLLAMLLATIIRGDLSTFIWVLVMLSGSVFTAMLVFDPARRTSPVS